MARSLPTASLFYFSFFFPQPRLTAIAFKTNTSSSGNTCAGVHACPVPFERRLESFNHRHAPLRRSSDRMNCERHSESPTPSSRTHPAAEKDCQRRRNLQGRKKKRQISRCQKAYISLAIAVKLLSYHDGRFIVNPLKCCKKNGQARESFDQHRGRCENIHFAYDEETSLTHCFL